jgi:hypothetical protein
MKEAVGVRSKFCAPPRIAGRRLFRERAIVKSQAPRMTSLLLACACAQRNMSKKVIGLTDDDDQLPSMLAIKLLHQMIGENSKHLNPGPEP